MSVQKPTLILNAGMPRSGTTWLFNIVRTMLTSTEQMAQNFSCGWIGDLNTMPMKPVMLVKVHDFHPEYLKPASFILYSFRDIRDVLASMYRKFDKEPTLEAADIALGMYAHWMRHANFVMKYEDMMAGQKLKIAEELAGRFQLSHLDIEKIVDEVEGMKASAGTETYDVNSLYHEGHITDGRHGSWEGIISPELEAQILQKHEAWFRHHGYID